jgi:hypothetical protein
LFAIPATAVETLTIFDVFVEKGWGKGRENGLEKGGRLNVYRQRGARCMVEIRFSNGWLSTRSISKDDEK